MNTHANSSTDYRTENEAVHRAERQIDWLVDYQRKVAGMVEALGQSTDDDTESATDGDVSSQQLVAMTPPYAAAEVRDMRGKGK